MFLLGERKYEDFVSKVSFLAEHPSINEQILQSAVISAILQRNDLANDIPNPLEVSHQKIFFYSLAFILRSMNTLYLILHLGFS